MTGKLALSKAGHDKNTLYLIMKEEQETVYLTDGCSRDIRHPKKKNKKHIQLINAGISREELEKYLANPAWGNNQIRERINRYTSREDSPDKSLG